MVTSILQSIENITKSITEVVSEMQEISAATEEVSSGTEQATAAGEEILSISPQFDENNKIKSYIWVRQVITELMVMSGIEQACKEDEEGKELSNTSLAECVRQLKFGDYQITDNV